MVAPTMVYHADDGSDTAASGSNAPTTAVTGTNADGTAAGTTITLNETVDFTGVNDDDSDVVWVNTGTDDRNLFTITSFTGGVSTCTALVTSESITSTFSALSWAVGGRRQTMQEDSSREDWFDFGAGWTITLNDGGVFVVSEVAAGVGGSIATGPTIWKTADGFATKAQLWRGTGNTGKLLDFTPATNTHVHFHDILFKRDASTTNNFVQLNGSQVTWRFERCDFDDSAGGPAITTATASQRLEFVDCDIQAGEEGFVTTASGHSLLFLRTKFHDCVLQGIKITWSGTSRSSLAVLDCIFDTCGGATLDGIFFSVTTSTRTSGIFIGNTFYNNGNNGLRLAGSTFSDSHLVSIDNNIFVDNAAFGLSIEDANGEAIVRVDTNAYFSNTSGATQNASNLNEITLTADPFTNAAASDFSLNATAGGGAAVDDEGLGLTG